MKLRHLNHLGFSLFCAQIARIGLYILLASSVAGRAQSWMQPETWEQIPAPTATLNINYVSSDTPGYAPASQQMDLYQNATTPAGAKAPVLIYMHGGAWNHGERPKSWHGFRPWLAAGFSVLNVEYRLVDVAPAPAALQDVRCVLAWVRTNADKYHLDPERVVTYGTSAGGHLALLAGVIPAKEAMDLPQCTRQARVVAVLDYYGPYHLEPSAPGAFTSSSTKRWMGADPKPSLEAMERAMSPSTWVHKGMPPVFQAHGDADPTVPYQASLELQKDLDKLGVKNALDTVPGGGHGGWPPEQNQRVALDSLKFLQSVGVIP